MYLTFNVGIGVGLKLGDIEGLGIGWVVGLAIGFMDGIEAELSWVKNDDECNVKNMKLSLNIIGWIEKSLIEYFFQWMQNFEI